MWYFDTNDDGQINGRDNDSNGDLHDDDEQVYVVFRTNASAGAYGAAGVWVALPESMTNVTASAPGFSASSALYVTAGEVESGKGEPYMVVYKGVPYSMRSPEGYEVRFFQNGSNDEVCIALAAATSRSSRSRRTRRRTGGGRTNGLPSAPDLQVAQGRSIISRATA